MKTKLFTLLLAIAVSIGTINAWDYVQVQIGNLYYNLDHTNRTAEVTYQSTYSSQNYSGLTTANIPASVSYNSRTYSVTSIGAWAFYFCENLTSVTIPNSVTSIGAWAFEGCSSLPIEDNLRYADTYLVEAVDKTLSAYTIKEGTKWIGAIAFKGCSSLTSITIPNSVTSIGYGAFEGCSSLPIEDNLRYADTYLVEAVDKTLSAYTIKEGTKWIGDLAFEGCSSLTSITIPNSVTSIGDWAFYFCENLTSVTIPNSVTSIGAIAFYGCSSLTSVVIPNSVTSIGANAFIDCTGLTSIEVANDNASYSSVDGVLFNKDQTTLIQYPSGKQGAYTIPNSVTSIGSCAFFGCSSLTSIVIPNSVTSIGAIAFYGCSSLTSVTIPNSVISIGDSAFYHCSSLTSIVIPNSVTSIGLMAFDGCSSLTSVVIPNSVTSIGSCAFDYYRLTSITNYATTPQDIGSYTFYENGIPCTLYVPAQSLSAYQNADGWKEFTQILPISAQAVEVTTIMVETTANTAGIAWPKVDNAYTYELVIKDHNGNIVCTLIFNSDGQLTSIAFNAPARNNAPQQTQVAGLAFTVTGLECGETYSYTLAAKDSNGNVLNTETGSFTTQAPLGFDEVPSNQVQSPEAIKLLRDGQVLILRGDKTYTLQGQEVK